MDTLEKIGTELLALFTSSPWYVQAAMVLFFCWLLNKGWKVGKGVAGTTASAVRTTADATGNVLGFILWPLMWIATRNRIPTSIQSARDVSQINRLLYRRKGHLIPTKVLEDFYARVSNLRTYNDGKLVKLSSCNIDDRLYRDEFTNVVTRAAIELQLRGEDIEKLSAKSA